MGHFVKSKPMTFRNLYDCQISNGTQDKSLIGWPEALYIHAPLNSSRCPLACPAFACASMREGGASWTRVISFDNNLALGYIPTMTKASEAARELARLSVSARRLKWGEKGFREKLQAWGKLGGRPRGKKGNRNAN
jgi:hypothetical protein